MNRKCKKCLKIKDISLFVKNKKCKDGHSYRCLDCNKMYWDEYYNRNRELIIYKTNIYAKDNPEIRSKINKKYSQNNKDKIPKIRKKWRENNPDKIKAINKKWIENNPVIYEEMKKKEYIRNKERYLKNRINITDEYVCTLIGVEKDKIPLEYIELKRAHLKLKRMIKTKNKICN